MGGKLVVCSACAVHVNVDEERCPHCGEEVYDRGGGILGRTAGAVLMGLTLAGCPAGATGGTSAAYGVPTTDSSTATGSTTDGDSSSTTTGEGDSTGSSTSTGASDSTGPSSSTGPGTSSGTDTGTGGSTTTGTGSTGISPDYGSPATD